MNRYLIGKARISSAQPTKAESPVRRAHTNYFLLRFFLRSFIIECIFIRGRYQKQGPARGRIVIQLKGNSIMGGVRL